MRSKKDLTGPTFLEMSDYRVYHDLAQIEVIFFAMNCKNDILSCMKEYEIIAAGDRCTYLDAMVESLPQAGIQAQQMLIADYDQLTWHDPEVHPRGAEVYVRGFIPCG